MELFRDMKMSKEGSIAIGDAFYNKGDLKTASRWYGKGGKENKTETSKKIGEAYLEDAFNETDPKLQKKAFDNSYKNLSKAYGAEEANRMIGNEFFDMGADQYPKAIEYYQKANYNEGILMIGDIYASKPETIGKAADIYVITKSKEGYRKAGDLYYNQGNYVKAMEYYVAGGVIDGYKKYAIELKKAGKTEMYNTVCEIISDSLKAQGKDDDVREIAIGAERDNNFVLAASLYKKLNEKELEAKYNAYIQMMKLEAVPAKELFQAMGREDMVRDIDANIKQLTTLQQSMMSLNELQKGAPKLSTKINQSTGMAEYDARDLSLRDQYYGNPATQKSISDVVYQISKDFQTLKVNEELRGLIRQSFLTYKPVKNILDTYTFTKKILPINITPAAVTF
jgi:tetratricopeptide (TPR) repeat protein